MFVAGAGHELCEFHGLVLEPGSAGGGRRVPPAGGPLLPGRLLGSVPPTPVT